MENKGEILENLKLFISSAFDFKGNSMHHIKKEAYDKIKKYHRER